MNGRSGRTGACGSAATTVVLDEAVEGAVGEREREREREREGDRQLDWLVHGLDKDPAPPTTIAPPLSRATHTHTHTRIPTHTHSHTHSHTHTHPPTLSSSAANI